MAIVEDKGCSTLVDGEIACLLVSAHFRQKDVGLGSKARRDIGRIAAAINVPAAELGAFLKEATATGLFTRIPRFVPARFASKLSAARKGEIAVAYVKNHIWEKGLYLGENTPRELNDLAEAASKLLADQGKKPAFVTEAKSFLERAIIEMVDRTFDFEPGSPAEDDA